MCKLRLRDTDRAVRLRPFRPAFLGGDIHARHVGLLGKCRGLMFFGDSAESFVPGDRHQLWRRHPEHRDRYIGPKPQVLADPRQYQPRPCLYFGARSHARVVECVRPPTIPMYIPKPYRLMRYATRVLLPER
jgi:hypothetical protein